MLVDVLAYQPIGGDPSYRACEAGEGSAIVAAHRREVRRRRVVRLAAAVLVGIPLAVYGIAVLGEPLLTTLAFGAALTVTLLIRSRREGGGDPVPEVVAESIRLAEATQRYDLDVTPT